MKLIRPIVLSRSRLIATRFIHSTTVAPANPLPHAAIPSAPPAAPAPAKELVEQIKQRKAANTSSQPSKRFWKDVHVVKKPEGLQVHLDTRPVRTPSKEILVIPASKPHLATAVAIEWNAITSAQQASKPHIIPLTSIVARALDLQDPSAKEVREQVVRVLMRYFHTDTLLCWAPERDDGRSESLRQKQVRIATPIIAHLTDKIWPGIEIQPVLDEGSILPREQSKESIEVVRSWLLSLPGWELAALERAVLATKSLLVGVRVIVEWGEEFNHLREEGDQRAKFGINEAEEAATMEVAWQTQQWGEVEDTHDVEREDLRRQLGSAILLVSGNKNM